MVINKNKTLFNKWQQIKSSKYFKMYKQDSKSDAKRVIMPIMKP